MNAALVLGEPEVPVSSPADVSRFSAVRMAAGGIVDLTLTIAEELPCWWSTHMPFQHKTFNYFADRDDQAAPLHNRTGPYQTRWMLIDEHTGTHLDAPAHFVPLPGSGLRHAGPAGTVTVEQVPLDQLSGPAVVIDVPDDLRSTGPGISPIIQPGVIEEFEARHGRIQPGEIVLFRSGWDSRYVAGEAGSAYCADALVTKTGPGWPAPEPPAMQVLLDRGVRCVGTDSPSMGSAHDGAPVHVLGLSSGAVYVEALANLNRLPVRGSWFTFAPLRLARGTGAPGRAFAYLPAEPDA